MKIKYIMISSIFILIYSLIFIYFLYKNQTSYDILIHFIFSLVGMIFLVMLNLKEKSNFVLFFTATSFLFYFFDSFFPVIYSLLKGENVLLNNRGFLSNTEGFIMFLGTGYILLILSRRNKE